MIDRVCERGVYLSTLCEICLRILELYVYMVQFQAQVDVISRGNGAVSGVDHNYGYSSR